MIPGGDIFQDKRVLSIDDSRAVRAFLASLLGEAGAQVDEAADAAEAIKTHTENVYDLILLDMVLPDADGMDVLRKLRERETDSTIVVLTGAGGVASATTAMQYGADGYVEKRYLTGQGGEPEFFYTLKQAMEHRAGHVARRQLEQLRTDFYSMVTHDLRNPAGAVLGLIKLLRVGKAGPLQAKQEDLLKVAQQSAEKFVGLINTYLDYSKIEAGYLRITPVETDLAALVSSSVQQIDVLASTKDQVISLQLPKESLSAKVDAPKIEQVIDNLLSNAVKYTPDGGSITVSLERSNGDALLTISDTGEGIPENQAGALFTKYHRVPGQSERGIKGTGLGLLIVKEIVEAHGGTVSAQSEGVPGKGSTFTVRIPLEPVSQPVA